MEVQGESWLTTKLDAFVDWAQKNSFWPLPFGTACVERPDQEAQAEHDSDRSVIASRPA